jgi:hypothetical protein
MQQIVSVANAAMIRRAGGDVFVHSRCFVVRIALVPPIKTLIETL